MNPNAGRFRSFVLASVKHYVANEHRRRRARKRGGGLRAVRLDADEAERIYASISYDHETPERIFERRWAHNVLHRSLARLRERYEKRGKTRTFDALSPLLTETPQRGQYKQLAEQLGMSDAALKVEVHRLRRRFGEALREEVEHLVAAGDDVDAEIRELLDAL